MFNAIVSPKSISGVLNGKTFVVTSDNKEFAAVKEAVRTRDQDALVRAVDRATAVNKFGAGKIVVIGGNVYYGNKELHGVVVDRVLELANQGFKPDPLLKFIENLYANPSKTAVDELYLFLETNNLPITEDGHFLAYKKVKGDYYDIYSGKFRNAPGDIVSMARNDVDDNRNRTCSAGLHFCSESYLPHYGTTYDNKVVLVKINPADVVSIPSDYDNAKGRTWKYEVLEDVTDRIGYYHGKGVYGVEATPDWADFDITIDETNYTRVSGSDDLTKEDEAYFKGYFDALSDVDDEIPF